MPSRWHAEKLAVVEAGREIARKGLVAGTAGNVSLRVGGPSDELVAITRSGKQYDRLSEDDILIISFDADVVEGDHTPSIESMMHIACYRARADVRAVVHTHSIYASALAVARLELPPMIDEMIVHLGGEVRIAAYGFPSSEELAASVAAALADRSATLMANHGVVGVGKDMREALMVCELVERCAQIYVLARAIGTVHELPADVIETEKELYKMAHRPEVDAP